MPIDLTGNRKKRPPNCVVTKAMAQAGVAQMDALVGLDLEQGITDEQLVAEIFAAMWKVYVEQVALLQGKNFSPPHSLILPPDLNRQ